MTQKIFKNELLFELKMDQNGPSPPPELSVVWRGLVWLGVVRVWGITSLTRLSQDDGTFTAANSLKLDIFYIIYFRYIIYLYI